MGYYTYHELRIYKLNDNKKLDILSDEEISEYKKKIRKKYPNAIFGEESKWYECEDEMKKYSLIYPELVFEVYGEGEEAGDLWCAYFHKGLMQYCPAIINYDEFSIYKLK